MLGKCCKNLYSFSAVPFLLSLPFLSLHSLPFLLFPSPSFPCQFFSCYLLSVRKLPSAAEPVERYLLIDSIENSLGPALWAKPRSCTSGCLSYVGDALRTREKLANNIIINCYLCLRRTVNYARNSEGCDGQRIAARSRS